jgi:Flp pilus assembly pilin Flp
VFGTRISSSEDDAACGASAVEYGLIVFAIAAVVALIVFGFGQVV